MAWKRFRLCIVASLVGGIVLSSFRKSRVLLETLSRSTSSITGSIPAGVTESSARQETREGITSWSTAPKSPTDATSSSFVPHGQCLSLGWNESMDRILAHYPQVFVTMPPKASGSSLKVFLSRCSGVRLPDNFLNSKTKREEALSTSLKIPTVMASHLTHESTLSILMEQTTRQSLIIYMYREETDRFFSSLKQVVLTRICSGAGKGQDWLEYFDARVDRNGTASCILQEQDLVKVIRDRPNEIGVGSTLSCQVFDDMQKYGPNIVFVHYKQSSQLQQLLAKHHCPHLVNETVTVNVAEEKPATVFVRTDDNKTVVQLEDWINHKRHFVEYALGSRTYTECQGKVRWIHDQCDASINLSPLGLLLL